MKLRANKYKKRLFIYRTIQQTSLIFSLFLGLNALALYWILPAELALSKQAEVLKYLSFILGGIGFLFILLFFFFEAPFKGIRFRVLKLLGLFLAYCFFHLFLLATYSLNAQSFKFDLQSVMETLYFREIGLTLGLGVLFLLLSCFNKKQGRKHPRFTAPQFDIGFLTFLLFLDPFTLRMIWGVSFGPINSNGYLQLLKPARLNQAVLSGSDLIHLIFTFAFVFIVTLGISALVYRGGQLLFSHRLGFSLTFTSSLFLAFIFNYALQFGIRVKSGGLPYQGLLISGATMFQVLLLTMIFLSFYLLINRFIISTVLIVALFGGFSIANALKFSLRGEPVYLSELSWLKNPGLLLSFVSLKSLLFVGVSFLLLGFLTYYLYRKFYKGPIISRKSALLMLGVLSLLFALVAQNFKNFTMAERRVKLPIVSDFMDIANGDVLWRGLPYTAQFKSESFVWMRQAFGSLMDQPKGYSKAKVEAVAKAYTTLAGQINQTREENITDQTVIYLLSESLANPNRLKGVTISENPLAQIDQIKANATGGLMFSNGYGGGTANMEAQALTGLPLSNYSDSVSIINSDVLPRIGFIPSISNLFQNKVALHPENASNYNRNVIYQKLGFQHFYAVSGTAKKDLLTNQQVLDGKVSDAQTYSDVLSKLNPKQNQFFSVLTMQNHMPFTVYSGSSQLEAKGEGYSAASNQLLQNYVRKINTTDSDTFAFLNELKKIDHKITVVFYGDHLPSLYPSALPFQSSPLTQYETDYFIWTNQGNQSEHHRNLNASEFTPALLETQNAKVSPYYALLTKVMDELPGEYNSPLGAQVKLTEAQEKVLNDLKLIQYDLTEGKGYLGADTSFYQLPK